MSFQRQGFAGPLDIISGEESQLALEQVQNELAKGTNRFKLHLVMPSIDKIAHHPKLVSAVKEALHSENIWLWSSDINTKEGRSANFFAPHQDATYAGLSPSSQCLTAWVALSDPIGANKGCLSFYPESHRLGQLPHQTEKNNNNMLTMGQYIESTTMQTLQSPISIPLRRGQATLHSFDCVHASGTNNSDKPRVGLALRYMTSNVVQTKLNREMASWICGSSPSETTAFDREPQLSSVAKDIQRGREVQKEALERWEANNFDAEPRLPSHPTEDQVERGRKAQREAMKYED